MSLLLEYGIYQKKDFSLNLYIQLLQSCIRLGLAVPPAGAGGYSYLALSEPLIIICLSKKY
jgi:hypothetical protein